MRKIFISIVNVIIMVAILVFVVLYSGYTSRESYRRQIEHFENTTVTMEQVTGNYLEGEQRVCDVWARYINNNVMTMEEAAEYIRSSHVLANTSAHLIFTDTFTGLSTRPKQGTADDYAVSYERVGLIDNMNWDDEIGRSINITRAYTNPMNGEQSLAFGNTVTLYDPEGEASREAVLLRVIPISELEQKWIFPQTELVNAELSMIDADGYYIIKGYSFKNSSFFEFYKSYNPTDPESAKQLFEQITSSTGSISMLNSHGQECILAFTPVAATAGWTMLGFVPAEDLHVDRENWLLFGVVSVGLLILFLCDMFYMFSMNKRLQATAREAESANKAMSDEGASFLDMPNLQFSVNKESKNLDMANEFMRFLITSEELNEMARSKGLMSPTKDLSFNSKFSAFGEVPESRILSPEEFGLTDDAVIQFRMAAFGVGTGAMTIEEAIAGYGTYAEE